MYSLLIGLYGSIYIVISTIIFSIGIQRLREMKWKHKHSLELLPLMCQKISPLNEKKETDAIYVAIFRAIREGFDEFVKEVLKKNLYLIWARDEQQATVFHQAVLYREENIFMLLHNQPAKDSVMKHTDDSLNNVLHMAGKSTPSARFKCIQGAVLQMQSELRWFKVISLTLYFYGIYFHYYQN